MNEQLLDFRRRVAKIDQLRASGEEIPQNLRITRDELRAMVNQIRGERRGIAENEKKGKKGTSAIQPGMDLRDLFKKPGEGK